MIFPALRSEFIKMTMFFLSIMDGRMGVDDQED